MSVGPMGVVGSALGSPLQGRGVEADRTQHDVNDQSRRTTLERKAENAAGIGETNEQEETSDRDADGRRLWEAPADATGAEAASKAAESPPPSKDATGVKGRNLDLSG